MKIVLATWNPDKIRWLTKGFEALGLPIEAADPANYENCEEDGVTCAENAEKKALSIGFQRDAIVVAEDSGLFLDGLGGFPGTHTARWSPGDDHDRALLLLDRMRGIENRQARFVSAICLLRPDGEKILCEGVLSGRVPSAYRGDPETGYAAIFELDDGRTIAETGAETVDAFNHRSRAMRSACAEIGKWLDRYRDKDPARELFSTQGFEHCKTVILTLCISCDIIRIIIGLNP